MKSKMKSGKLYSVGFKKSTRRKLIAGLLVVFPVFITFFVIKFLFTMIGGILSPVVIKAVGFLDFLQIVRLMNLSSRQSRLYSHLYRSILLV
jgi:uncharacterized membrane protein